MAMVLFDRIGDKLIEDQSAQIFSGSCQAPHRGHQQFFSSIRRCYFENVDGSSEGTIIRRERIWNGFNACCSLHLALQICKQDPLHGCDIRL